MNNLSEIGAALAAKLSELDPLIEEAKAALAGAAKANAEISEPFIGKKEAAEFLNMGISTLENRLSQRNPPPHYKEGGKLNFRRSELIKWRERWRVE